MRQMQLYIFVSVTLGALFAIEQRIWKNSVSCIDQSYYVAAFSIIEAWMCRKLVLSSADVSQLIFSLPAQATKIWSLIGLRLLADVAYTCCSPEHASNGQSRFDGPKRWRPRLELKSMRGTVHAGSWRYHCPETEYRSTSACMHQRLLLHR